MCEYSRRNKKLNMLNRFFSEMIEKVQRLYYPIFSSAKRRNGSRISDISLEILNAQWSGKIFVRRLENWTDYLIRETISLLSFYPLKSPYSRKKIHNIIFGFCSHQRKLKSGLPHANSNNGIMLANLCSLGNVHHSKRERTRIPSW